FRFKDMLINLVRKNNNKGITPLETLNIALASRIGVGSLAGVSLAIYYGGIGSIFWMWVSAIICSANAFCESVLGSKYQKKDKDDIYTGGPSYYIEGGLGNKPLALIYAIIVTLAYIVGFLTIQANTIVKSITEVYNIKPYIIALIIIILLFLIIVRGVKGIAKATSKIVPIMSISYIFITLFIVISNIKIMPSILINIVENAFNFKSVIIGFIPTLIIGIQRGLFSNEAGIGSGAIAAATTNVDSSVRIGYVQMIGVYFTTLVICTLTALVVISSNYEELSLLDVNGIEITQNAFHYHIGVLGHYVVMSAIVLFAFSTIITGYFYGESNLKYIFNKLTNKGIYVFKLLVLIILLMGSITSPTIIWNIVDNFVLLMALINIYALIMLRHEIFAEYQYYKYKKLISKKRR
ncbi:MAG: alanine/glycine:cation symporter family protein, partial [Bacilli bacterium]|nr:alanine/glycine:cation symporter family protein [Bacilli bacterium]